MPAGRLQRIPQLFIADTTKQRLTRPVSDLVPVGEAEVRGRKAKVLLWSISDEEPSTPAAPASERVEAQKHAAHVVIQRANVILSFEVTHHKIIGGRSDSFVKAEAVLKRLG